MNVKISKSALIDRVSKHTTLSRSQITEAYELIFAEMSNEILAGNTVGIPNLGVLRPVVRKARAGTMPSTGKPMTIPESHSVSFKMSLNLRKRIKAVAPPPPSPPPQASPAPGPKPPPNRPPAGSDPGAKTVQSGKRPRKRSGA